MVALLLPLLSTLDKNKFGNNTVDDNTRVLCRKKSREFQFLKCIVQESLFGIFFDATFHATNQYF